MASETTIFARQALLPAGWARDVAVTIDRDGRIGSVTSGVTAAASSANHVLDILLPAPVNVHSHGFQRAMAGLTERRGPDPEDSFWTWRELMYRFLDCLTPEDVEAITALVQMEMLEAGYATNTEFHYLHHQPDGSAYVNLAEMSERVIAAAEDTGIGLTLLPVFYQYGGCDQRPLQGGQRRFGNDLDQYALLYQVASSRIRQSRKDSCAGVAPHSLRAVSPDGLREGVRLAGEKPVHLHLAEQKAEVEEVQKVFGARPVEWLLGNMDVSDRWCLIHCTQMEPHETERLSATGAVAGICPITEFNLGDGIFDAVRWLGKGGGMAIGSDSNIRISLSEELRLLEYSQRLRDHSRAALALPDQSTGRRLYEAICKGGAQAAGRATGRIDKGLWADFLALDATTPVLAGASGDVLLDCWIFAGDDRLVTDVWSAGRHMVQGGRHIRHDRIEQRYLAVMNRLRDRL